MQYWLRRNNIDSGPFSKEALLSQGLNPADLIRIDGESTWKPLSTFTELQSSLHGSTKPKYKFTADKKLIEIKEVEEPNKEVDPKTDVPSGPTPFKRIPSALPKKKINVPPAVNNTSAAINEKAKERSRITAKMDKAEETTQPHAQVSLNTTVHQKAHAHVHSIDEAPLKEIRHHPTPKPIRTTSRPQNSHFFKEFFLPIIIIGGIGFLAWWGYKKFTGPATYAGLPASLSTNDSLYQKQAAALSDSQKNESNKESPASVIAHHINAMHLKDSSSQTAKGSKAIKDSSKTVKAAGTTAQTISEVPKNNIEEGKTAAATKTPAITNMDGGTAVNNTTTVTKNTDSPTHVSASITAIAPEKKQTVQKTAKTSSINDYVNLSLNKTPEPGIKNIKIKIHNTSKDDLNIAVVEVKYFDTENKFIQGETLQTGKIDAGKTATLKIPSNKNATRISYKVSLISGDNVYLMGQ